MQITRNELKNPEMSISYDKLASRVVTKFIDPDSHEVIKQLPSEELIRLAISLKSTIGTKVNEYI